jgi:hypothetical protein
VWVLDFKLLDATYTERLDIVVPPALNIAVLAMAEVNVTQDYGAMLIGGLLAFRCVINIDQQICDLSPRSLSGCVNMQFIVYWRLYSDEPYRAKSLVRKLINSSSKPFSALHRSLQYGMFVYSECEMDTNGIQAS